jgi:hypothetical protein
VGSFIVNWEYVTVILMLFTALLTPFETSRLPGL